MSEPLHDLIHGLSKGEKRFFTLLHSHYLQDNPSNTMQLFSAVDQLEKWDETKLTKRNTNKTFLNHLAAEKKRLQQELLDTLVYHHRDATVNFTIRHLYCQSEILFERKLFKQGEKLLRKGLQLAEEACLFELKLEGLRIFNEKAFSQLDIIDAEEVFTERETLMKKLLEADRYTTLTIRLIKLGADLRKMHSEKPSSDEIIQLSHDPMLGKNAIPLSPLSQLGFHSFWSQYASIKRNNEERAFHGDRIFDLLIKHPLVAEGNPSQFFAAASNTIVDAFALGNETRLRNIRGNLSEHKDRRKKWPAGLAINFESLVMLSCIYENLLSANFSEIIRASGNAEEIVQQLAKQKSVRSFIIGFFIGFAFFADENYRKAIKFLSTIDIFSNAAQFEDRELKLRYLQLLCHFELGHSDTVLRQIVSIRRQARRFGTPLKSEEVVLDFFQQAVKLEGLKLRKQIRHVLETIHGLENDPSEKIFKDFNYFLVTWMKSKINGNTFREEWKIYTSEKIKNRSNLLPY